MKNLRHNLAEKLHNFWQLWKLALVNFVPNNSDFNSVEDDNHDEPIWVVDSGSKIHGVKDLNLLRNIVPRHTFLDCFTGNISTSKHVGDACLPIITTTSSKVTTISLSGVLHVPDLAYNLISVSRLTTDFPMLLVEFNSREFFVKNFKTDEVIAKGQKVGHYYIWLRDNEIHHQNTPRSLYKSFLVYLNDLVAIHLKRLLRDAIFASDFTKIYDTKINPANEGTLENNTLWILDSGAPVHVANNVASLDCHNPNARKVRLGDIAGRTCVVTHVGNTYLGGRTHRILLHSVQIVTEAKDNLISVGALTSKNSCCIKFFSSGFALKSIDEDKVIAMGVKVNNYYYLSNKSFQLQNC